MRVFIDAMIYIKYFSADLVQSKILQKIEQLADEGKIKLVFPDIAYDEVYRNSIEEISDYKKKIKFPSLIGNLPPLVLEGKTYSEAKKLAGELNEKMVELQKEYQASMDILMKTVEALKNKAEKITEPEDLFEKANKRRLLGKLPYPTKPIDGLGDGMVWELLLGINDTERTIIVTEDWGWKNQKEGDPNVPHPSLQKEWNNSTRGEIKLYNSLSDFLKKELPEVKISRKDIELDKKVSLPQAVIGYGTVPVWATLQNPNTVGSVMVGSLASVSNNLITGLVPNSLASVGVAQRVLPIVICPNCGTQNEIEYSLLVGEIHYCKYCQKQLPS